MSDPSPLSPLPSGDSTETTIVETGPYVPLERSGVVQDEIVVRDVAVTAPPGPGSWGTGVVAAVLLGIGVLALLLFLALRNNGPTGASTTTSAPVVTSSPTPAPVIIQQAPSAPPIVSSSSNSSSSPAPQTSTPPSTAAPTTTSSPTSTSSP